MEAKETDPTRRWTEQESVEFVDLGRFIVPDRNEQIRTFCALVPGEQPGAHLVELACGEGRLAAALLERFPQATLHGYDGSETMLAHARRALEAHGTRFDPQRFDLEAEDWRVFAFPVQAFVSSLVLHHLVGPGKKRLFADLAKALAPGGALLIADLVEPASSEARAHAARSWDESVHASVLEHLGNLEPSERFRHERWNYFADPAPDSMDQPSTLLEQLDWLREAGLVGVDVFWMKAGHALFGARKAS